MLYKNNWFQNGLYDDFLELTIEDQDSNLLLLNLIQEIINRESEIDFKFVETFKNNAEAISVEQYTLFQENYQNQFSNGSIQYRREFTDYIYAAKLNVNYIRPMIRQRIDNLEIDRNAQRYLKKELSNQTFQRLYQLLNAQLTVFAQSLANYFDQFKISFKTLQLFIIALVKLKQKSLNDFNEVFKKLDYANILASLKSLQNASKAKIQMIQHHKINIQNLSIADAKVLKRISNDISNAETEQGRADILKNYSVLEKIRLQFKYNNNQRLYNQNILQNLQRKFIDLHIKSQFTSSNFQRKARLNVQGELDSEQELDSDQENFKYQVSLIDIEADDFTSDNLIRFVDFQKIYSEMYQKVLEPLRNMKIEHVRLFVAIEFIFNKDQKDQMGQTGFFPTQIINLSQMNNLTTLNELSNIISFEYQKTVEEIMKFFREYRKQYSEIDINIQKFRIQYYSEDKTDYSLQIYENILNQDEGIPQYNVELRQNQEQIQRINERIRQRNEQMHQQEVQRIQNRINERREEQAAQIRNQAVQANLNQRRREGLRQRGQRLNYLEFGKTGKEVYKDQMEMYFIQLPIDYNLSNPFEIQNNDAIDLDCFSLTIQTIKQQKKTIIVNFDFIMLLEPRQAQEFQMKVLLEHFLDVQNHSFYAIIDMKNRLVFKKMNFIQELAEFNGIIYCDNNHIEPRYFNNFNQLQNCVNQYEYLYDQKLKSSKQLEFKVKETILYKQTLNNKQKLGVHVFQHEKNMKARDFFHKRNLKSMKGKILDLSQVYIDFETTNDPTPNVENFPYMFSLTVCIIKYCKMQNQHICLNKNLEWRSIENIEYFLFQNDQKDFANILLNENTIVDYDLDWNVLQTRLFYLLDQLIHKNFQHKNYLNAKQEPQPVQLIAHNGYKFDFKFILQKVIDNYQGQVVGSFQSLKGYHGNKIQFFDTVGIMPMSLDKMGKEMQIPEEFRKKDLKELDFSKNIIDLNFVAIKILDNQEMLELMVNYNKFDTISLCLCLLKFWKELTQILHELNPNNPKKHFIFDPLLFKKDKVAQLAVLCFQESLTLDAELPGDGQRQNIEMIKMRTTGGVTTVGKYGIRMEARGYYDINSLYPTVMANHQMPFGEIKPIAELNNLTLKIKVKDLKNYFLQYFNDENQDLYAIVKGIKHINGCQYKNGFNEIHLHYSPFKIRPLNYNSKTQKIMVKEIIPDPDASVEQQELMMPSVWIKLLIQYYEKVFNDEQEIEIMFHQIFKPELFSQEMSKYINDIYQRRVQAKNNNQNAKQYIFKLLLNSLYGKLSQVVHPQALTLDQSFYMTKQTLQNTYNLTEEQLNILGFQKHEGKAELFNDQGHVKSFVTNNFQPKHYLTPQIVIYKRNQILNQDYDNFIGQHVITGDFILRYAQFRYFALMTCQIHLENPNYFLTGDTDSVIMTREFENLANQIWQNSEFEIRIGNALGEVKQELSLEQLQNNPKISVIAPKIYCFEFDNLPIKYAFKGFRDQVKYLKIYKNFLEQNEEENKELLDKMMDKTILETMQELLNCGRTNYNQIRFLNMQFQFKLMQLKNTPNKKIADEESGQTQLYNDYSEYDKNYIYKKLDFNNL